MKFIIAISYLFEVRTKRIYVCILFRHSSTNETDVVIAPRLV